MGSRFSFQLFEDDDDSTRRNVQIEIPGSYTEEELRELLEQKLPILMTEL